jgi:hypothetical protein
MQTPPKLPRQNAEGTCNGCSLDARTVSAATTCTATQVRSLGLSQLGQGAMPALAATLRFALLGRLTLAGAISIGHDGVAAAANMAPQGCWSAPSRARVCIHHAGEATCGEDGWCGVVPPEMFGQGNKGRWLGPLMRAERARSPGGARGSRGVASCTVKPYRRRSDCIF